MSPYWSRLSSFPRLGANGPILLKDPKVKVGAGAVVKVVGLLSSRTRQHARSGLTKGAPCPLFLGPPAHQSGRPSQLGRTEAASSAARGSLGSGGLWQEEPSLCIFLSGPPGRQMFGGGSSAGSPQEAPSEEAGGISRLPGIWAHSRHTP